MDFKTFNKIPRFSREMIITEKIDGTNGLIAIGENGEFQVGSRNKWLTDEQGNIQSDNAGFARWCVDNKEQLLNLGVGFHYGEWWGKGIQRGYGLTEKRFSLFNVGRWADTRQYPDGLPEGKVAAPLCCYVVPVLLYAPFRNDFVDGTLNLLKHSGSIAAPGFMNPEGIVIYHMAGGYLFKKTIEKDEQPKGEVNAN